MLPEHLQKLVPALEKLMAEKDNKFIDVTPDGYGVEESVFEVGEIVKVIVNGKERVGKIKEKSTRFDFDGEMRYLVNGINGDVFTTITRNVYNKGDLKWQFF